MLFFILMKISTRLIPFLGALLFLSVAFVNGFPLVENDTANYIITGIEDQISPDRTPFYGLFLRFTSMWSSLWFTVFAQSLLLAFALSRYIKLVFGERVPAGLMTSLYMVIAGFTAISWMASFLMPDVFTGILVLIATLYFNEKDRFRFSEFVYPFFLLGIISIHNSHFLIASATSVIFITAGLVQRKWQLLRRALTMLAMAIGFFFLMCNMNNNYGNGFTFSKASHVFMITKFAETGILKKYLDDNCEKKQLKLCAFKENIQPVSWVFLWADNSPLTVTGGWDANKKDDSIIIHDIFTTPKYLGLFAQKSLIYTCKQLFTAGVPSEATVLGEGTMMHRTINDYFKDEAGEYVTSMQNSTRFHGDLNNIFYIMFFLFTSLILLVFPNQLLTSEIKRIYLFIGVFIIINAFVTATFSTVLPRYQCRVFWILPATNIVVIARYLYAKYAKKQPAI